MPSLLKCGPRFCQLRASHQRLGRRRKSTQRRSPPSAPWPSKPQTRTSRRDQTTQSSCLKPIRPNGPKADVSGEIQGTPVANGASFIPSTGRNQVLPLDSREICSTEQTKPKETVWGAERKAEEDTVPLQGTGFCTDGGTIVEASQTQQKAALSSHRCSTMGVGVYGVYRCQICNWKGL